MHPVRPDSTVTVNCEENPVECLRLCPGGAACYELAEPPPPPIPVLPRATPDADRHAPVRLLLTVSLLSAFLFLSLALATLLLYRRRRRILRRRRRAAAAAAAGAVPDEDWFGDGDEEGGGGGGVLHHVWYIRTVGLDNATIASIATVEYRGGVGRGGDCAVCLGEFSDGELVRLLPRCAHPFHAPCIDTWLRAHVSCPICRSPVVEVATGIPAAAPEPEADGAQHEEREVLDEMPLSELESQAEASEDSEISSDAQTENTTAAADDSGKATPNQGPEKANGERTGAAWLAGEMARRRGGAAAAAASPAVVGAISVMAVVYYSTVFVFLDHWLGLGTTAGAAHAAAVSLAVAACFFAFVCAAAADPGAVPKSFAPDAEAAQGQGLKSRYCDKCCMFKPPRSHHCKVCKRCVLKMDHHCVWINNCVGYANYKAFIICVLNATIGSLYSFVIFLCDVLFTEHEFDIVYVKMVYILAGVLLFFLSLTIGSLLCWHIYLLCHNMTTIEYREAVRAKWLAKKSGQKYRHRFDLGMRKNIQMIMGPNILCWLCPTATGHLKDGTEFQITNN